MDAERAARERFETVLMAVTTAAGEADLSFKSFERRLMDDVMGCARALVTLFLVRCEQRIAAATPSRIDRGERVFRRAPAQARNLNTLFGIVRYWRLYMREVIDGECRGFHPLDAALGLTSERISMNVLALAARLALPRPGRPCRGSCLRCRRRRSSSRRCSASDGAHSSGSSSGSHPRATAMSS